ncbi:malonyl-ACP O-methyltransferase BioC [Parachitinimonas caeni]|uniref:Malonyl-[acyl-carrier protein] O-methyltransferase n=1 Tax=Parachitinimonas caeni TaxID=3031301 RepID=A0ABT7DVI7_9NEIS|nr:malonyl-ACP O-methyltransferase BioC [Parachitinimonas caeni]MDK2124004.1 malonyl-ACP O-methyltransferase BioC [Parachitinimonas caeni]
MDEPFFSEKVAVRQSFDAAAHHYDQSAVLQREVANRLDERFDYVKLQPTRLLDLGSGTGYGRDLLSKRFPDVQVIELDLALSMLQVAKSKASFWAKGWSVLRGVQRTQVCADAENLPFAGAVFDVVWSNLTIQWCNTPDSAFADAWRVLKPGGLFTFSTLGPDTLMELRSAFQTVDDQPHVNRFIDMHDIGDALVKAGFGAPVIDMERITMQYDTVKDVMLDLKGIGAHNVASGRRRGLLGKQAWQKVVGSYEQFRCNGKLPASYEVIYGHAWKPESASKKVLQDGRQVIDFFPKQG